MFTLRELMFIYSCCVNIFISLFSFLCCNCQQAMEDLMEDEDEDFDKDDKVIMSCVRDALTHKHIHKRMRSHTYTHTRCLRRCWHHYIHRKHKQTKEMTPSSPPISTPVQLFSAPEAQTHVQRLYNLLTFWKVSSVGMRTAHSSSFFPRRLLRLGLFLQSATLCLFLPSYKTQYRIYVTNAVLQSCFLRTCTHIKCLVSYLGPFTAPLCSSKTASGLVQTLSGNNRWLLYCLRSFALLKTATETNATGKDTVPCQCPTWER